MIDERYDTIRHEHAFSPSNIILHNLSRYPMAPVGTDVPRISYLSPPTSPLYISYFPNLSIKPPTTWPSLSATVPCKSVGSGVCTGAYMFDQVFAPGWVTTGCLIFAGAGVRRRLGTVFLTLSWMLGGGSFWCWEGMGAAWEE